jgi:hypothetical protein
MNRCHTVFPIGQIKPEFLMVGKGEIGGVTLW